MCCCSGLVCELTTHSFRLTAALFMTWAGSTVAAPLANTLPPELADPSVEAVESHPRQGLPNFFAKLKQGKDVRIAYFGGSITAQDGWRPKTLKWFQEQYPNAKVSEINAAIGGTGSDLGVFRCGQDVLAEHPDLVFEEFAVNDGGASPEQIYRCMEGIVRQTWRANPETDICFVYTLAGNMLETLQAGKYPRAASAMEKLADFYGIPSINRPQWCRWPAPTSASAGASFPLPITWPSRSRTGCRNCGRPHPAQPSPSVFGAPPPACTTSSGRIAGS
jgi:hypothetical protein